jgi:hypothetical protein
MDLPLNAAIACTDGPCGHSIAIILIPVSDQVTHLVVREPRLFDTERSAFALTPVLDRRKRHQQGAKFSRAESPPLTFPWAYQMRKRRLQLTR